jgi:hypothetical protein
MDGTSIKGELECVAAYYDIAPIVGEVMVDGDVNNG